MTRKQFFLRIYPVILMTGSLVTSAVAQWQENVLYSFQNGSDGAWPVGSVVFDASGNLYGATITGGAPSCLPVSECGTVYQLAPPIQPGGTWTETVLYVFKGKPYNDGATPAGGLVMDGFGNIYGTTAYGGTGNCLLLGIQAGCGTVYKLSPPAQQGGAWTETVLYSFPSYNEGYFPAGDLVFDRAGNLYGATIYGGGRGTNCGDGFYPYCGTIFELSRSKTLGGAWTEQLLYRFRGLPGAAASVSFGDGANPNGGLAIDSTGAIYGTTQIGGFDCPHSEFHGCGTIFKLAPPTKQGQSWNETVIHRFTAGPDGGEPWAGLTFDGSGNLYGTTRGGGTGNQQGIAFQLVLQPNGKWTKSTLHNFGGNDDGGQPESSVVFDAKGNLYGAAATGGMGRGGTVYQIQLNAPNPSFDVLHGFSGKPDGSFPNSPLLFDSIGNIYGTTLSSGAGTACGNLGCGTVFKVSP